MKSMIFFSISAAFGVWCAISPSWQLVSVSLIMASIGGTMLVISPKKSDANKSEIDYLRSEMEKIRGALALYGITRDV